MKRSERGEIATILTIGTLIVIGVTAVVSSLFVNQKQTTNSKAAINCSLFPLDDCPDVAGCKVSGSYCVTDPSYSSSTRSSSSSSRRSSSSSSRRSSSSSSIRSSSASSVALADCNANNMCAGQTRCYAIGEKDNAGNICCGAKTNPRDTNCTWNWPTWNNVAPKDCRGCGGSSSSAGPITSCPPAGGGQYEWKSYTECICMNCELRGTGGSAGCYADYDSVVSGSKCCQPGQKGYGGDACQNYNNTHSSSSSSRGNPPTTGSCRWDDSWGQCVGGGTTCAGGASNCQEAETEYCECVNGGASSSSSRRSSSSSSRSSSSSTGTCEYANSAACLASGCLYCALCPSDSSKYNCTNRGSSSSSSVPAGDCPPASAPHTGCRDYALPNNCYGNEYRYRCNNGTSDINTKWCCPNSTLSSSSSSRSSSSSSRSSSSSSRSSSSSSSAIGAGGDNCTTYTPNTCETFCTGKGGGGSNRNYYVGGSPTHYYEESCTLFSDDAATRENQLRSYCNCGMQACYSETCGSVCQNRYPDTPKSQTANTNKWFKTGNQTQYWNGTDCSGAYSEVSALKSSCQCSSIVYINVTNGCSKSIYVDRFVFERFLGGDTSYVNVHQPLDPGQSVSRGVYKSCQDAVWITYTDTMTNLKQIAISLTCNGTSNVTISGGACD